MTVRICMEGKEIMGEIYDGTPGRIETHGICLRCMRKNHPKVYKANRHKYALEYGERASFSPLLNNPPRFHV